MHSEHVINYYYLLICKYESIGNTHAAKHYLGLIWDERKLQ